MVRLFVYTVTSVCITVVIWRSTLFNI